MKQNIKAFILAGGKSSRMGKDKCMLELKGKMLIEIIYGKLKKIFDKVYINANKEYPHKNFYYVRDIIKDKGPLAGIYSCLMFSDTEQNFFIPCDTPLIGYETIITILKEALKYDNVWASVNGTLHPLIGIYHKNLIPVIKDNLEHNKLKIKSLYQFFHTVKFLENKEIEFFNINTQKDFEKFLSLQHKINF